MRNSLLFSSLIALFGCAQSSEKEDNRSQMLTAEFATYENFMPLKTLDLSRQGIKDKIHVIFVDFDPDADGKDFPGNDHMDNFCFKIESDGKYRPLFEKSALKIGPDYEEFFREDLEAYKKAKEEKDSPVFIDVSDEPEWIQDDETPLNSKGKPMKFICQADMGRININDDCRLFVFYDEADRIVRYIYQRT